MRSAVIVDTPARLNLYADSGRLRQVADILLSNAARYTPAGGTITITAALDGEQTRITWAIADTGIGIPTPDRPQLFRSFSALLRASTRARPRSDGRDAA